MTGEVYFNREKPVLLWEDQVDIFIKNDEVKNK